MLGRYRVMSVGLSGLIGMDLRPGYPQPAVDSLLAEWQAASMDSVWLRPGDWYHPAVEALAEALTDGLPTAPAADRLGEARGHVGISMGETIDDLACLFRAWGTEPGLDTLRALSTGWVRGNEPSLLVPLTTDPRSGLATPEYLVQRLRETYGAGERSGRPASRTHCLLLVDVAVDRLDGWQRVARAAAMGKIFSEVFGTGHPVATLGAGVYAALCERSADLEPLRAELRHRIERTALSYGVTAVLRRPPRVWVEPLPTAHTGATSLLQALGR